MIVVLLQNTDAMPDLDAAQRAATAAVGVISTELGTLPDLQTQRATLITTLATLVGSSGGIFANTPEALSTYNDELAEAIADVMAVYEDSVADDEQAAAA